MISTLSGTENGAFERKYPGGFQTIMLPMLGNF